MLMLSHKKDLKHLGRATTTIDYIPPHNNNPIPILMMMDVVLSNRMVYSFWAPFVLSMSTLLVSSEAMEWFARQPWSRDYHITYRPNEERWKDTPQDKKILSKRGEIYECLQTMVLSSLLGSLSLWALQLDIFSDESIANTPSSTTMLQQFLAYYYLYDFLFFAVHYAMHKNDFLWKHVHSVHHQDHTPSALATAHGELSEFMAVSGLPHLVSILLIQPHAYVVYGLLVFVSVLGIYNHAGFHMNNAFDDIFLLGKILPFRSTPRHHDAHHRCSGRSATNVGFSTWLWDYLAGTLMADKQSSSSKIA